MLMILGVFAISIAFVSPSTVSAILSNEFKNQTPSNGLPNRTKVPANLSQSDNGYQDHGSFNITNSNSTLINR